MSDLFIPAPFISHDGGDDAGVRAEVLVQKGVGVVTEIDTSKEKTAKIKVNADNLKFQIAGWLNTDTEAFKFVQKKYESQEPLSVRFEQKRLKNDTDSKEPISRSTPINELLADPTTGKHTMDLARRHAIKLLVAVGEPDGEPSYKSQQLTNPAEDPVFGGVKSALDIDVQTSKPAATPRYSPEIFEAHPWNSINPNGNVNPGAYAVGAFTEFYFIMKKRLPADYDKTKICSIASNLLIACDWVQKKIYDGSLKAADRNIASYQRIREIMKNVIEQNDENPNDENTREWLKNVMNDTLQIYKWAYADYERTIK
jgi:hypothetical protein